MGVELTNCSNATYPGDVNYSTTWGGIFLRTLLYNNDTVITDVQSIQKENTVISVNRTAPSFIDGAASLPNILNGSNLTGSAVSIHPGALNKTIATQLPELLSVVNLYALPGSTRLLLRLYSTPQFGKTFNEGNLLSSICIQAVDPRRADN